jgi:hypothetical protein
MALALPAPAMATSVSALFNDASTDPFLVQGSYDNYLSSFNIIAGVAPETPDAVRQGIAAAANQRLPVALLLLVDGLLRPYFLPFRRDQAVGVPPHPATDNKLFAFDGELIQGQGVVVEIPNQWFNLIPNTTVATWANIQGLLGGDVNLQLLGPFNAGDADTQEVRTRSVVAIPNKYVGLFLSQPEGVTPRYYFETILPVIEADGMGQTCMPLTRFCQVAITHSALNAVSTLQVEMPVAPPRHVPLLTQASTMLHHHLPALSAGHAGGGVNLQPLVNTIVAGQQQRQQEQDQVRADKLLKETTTVESWLGPENFRRLLKYCGVALEADLPPLWPALAKANAKDRLGIFQGKVANELLAMGAVYEKYIPNLYLLTEVTALRWTMVNPDALESGSMANAFLFTDSDVEAEQGISRQIGFVQSGGAAPSLADAHTLLKSKVNLPGPDDSIRALRRMQAVYRAVLPVGHPLTNFLGQHYDVMRAFDPSWHNYATHVPELRGLKGVFHLQWLSLKLTKYFTQHDHNFNVITCPDPTAIVDSIQEQRQWEPNLTDVFVSRYNVQAFINVHSRGTPSIVTASTAGLTSSASSVVSGLTATPSVAPSIGGQAAGGRSSGGSGSRSNSTGDRIENTHFNTALFGVYKTSTIKSKELRKKIERGELPPLPPSKANASKPVCLAWHTKGQCSSLCPHSADHIAYSADEYASLVTWCRDHGYASL